MRKAVLCGLTFALLLLTAGSQVYVRHGNLWDTFLERNVESSLVLFQDGTIVVTTLYAENITVLPDWIFKKKPIDTVLVIIHNHVNLDRWSEMDDRTNHWLRRKGYAGPILLRLGNGKVLKWEE